MDWWVAVSGLVRNVGLIAAAVVGLVLAGMRVVAANRQADAALRQTEFARRGHVAELFNRAVGQLDDDKLQVRLARSTRFVRLPKISLIWPERFWSC